LVYHLLAELSKSVISANQAGQSPIKTFLLLTKNSKIMKIKNGVTMNKLSSQIVLALITASGIYQANGQELVITSITDAVHKKESLHYTGNAVDLRTNVFSSATAKKVSQQLAAALGNNFDVVLESDHIHVEFDPDANGLPF
jgi:acyl CoA:acetate/3-ketoacid CoA transferase beta subunit